MLSDTINLVVWSEGLSVDIEYSIGNGIEVLNAQISCMLLENDSTFNNDDFVLIDYLGRQVKEENDLIYLNSLSFQQGSLNPSRYIVPYSSTNIFSPVVSSTTVNSSAVPLWLVYNTTEIYRHSVPQCSNIALRGHGGLPIGDLLQPSYQ